LILRHCFLLSLSFSLLSLIRDAIDAAAAAILPLFFFHATPCLLMMPRFSIRYAADVSLRCYLSLRGRFAASASPHALFLLPPCRHASHFADICHICHLLICRALSAFFHFDAAAALRRHLRRFAAIATLLRDYAMMLLSPLLRACI